MIYYILCFYIFVFGTVNTSLYNENCTGCYRQTARKTFNEIMLRHLYEATISSNLSARVINDTFRVKIKCSGAIVTSSTVITVASFFENNSKTEEYAVYVGHVIPNRNKDLRIHQIDKIFKHPDFTNGIDIALVKVKTNFRFNMSGCTMASLPDNPMDFTKTKRPICTILNHHLNTLGVDILSGAEVDILTKEECEDIFRMRNLTLSLNTSPFCVKVRGSSDELVDIIGGSTCFCGGTVRGIITNTYNRMSVLDPIAVTDLGLHTTWIRSNIVNLNQVSTTSSMCINHELFTLLFILLLYYSN